MSDPTDMLPEVGKVATSGAGGSALTLLALWLFKRKEAADDGQDAALQRIEAKLAEMHTEWRLLGERFLGLEHTVDGLKECINGGLANHAARIEEHDREITRLKTLEERRGDGD